MFEQPTFLMCAPTHFKVDYVINPWMEGNENQAAQKRAREQWDALYELVGQYAEVKLIEQAEGWPDMVFTANAGLVLGDQAIVSRFYHKERKGEEPYFREWFDEHGFRTSELPPDIYFEGAGDALFDRGRPVLWAAYGFRSRPESQALLHQRLEVEVLSLLLVDPRFYHLDTCFCPLAGGYAMYFPAAFDMAGLGLIERRIPEDKRIVLEEADAEQFAANAVNIGKTVILHKASDKLKKQLDKADFEVKETPLDEFMKAGGAAKCLTLRLDEAVAE